MCRRIACIRFLLVFGAIACLNRASFAQTQPGEEPVHPTDSSRLSISDTYLPTELRESWRDQLSGGIPMVAPFRMAEDNQNRLLVSDPAVAAIQVFDRAQDKKWQFRGDRSHRLIHPTYITVDDVDNIYIADAGWHAVLVFSPLGRYLRTIGAEYLVAPAGLAIDKSSQRLYVADYLRGEIQVYGLRGQLQGYLQGVISENGQALGQLFHPLDVAIHGEELIVLDSGNGRFQMFDLDGNVRGARAFAPDQLPGAFALDSAGNTVYIDVGIGGVAAMNAEGKPVAFLDQQYTGGYAWLRPTVNFVTIANKTDGGFLVIRPDFQLDLVKLASQSVGPNPPAVTTGPSEQH